VVAARAFTWTALGLLLSLATEVCVLFGGEGLGAARMATLLHAFVLVEATVALLA